MNSLAPGDRIGPYEVRAALGAGGMGEVYRAHDTTLGREVALKVLTGRFAGDAGRLTRLDREARILASLNHPNIATIHGMVPSDAGPALVLELVEGPTLEDRLAPGALPLDETLHYARQIAEALEAAHELGVVHRDLKPGNIKIRPDGTVKVLDFGIAKILDADQRAGPGATTVTSTGEGVLIGTTHYMSPEQARGAEVTRRSDVWAFGAILFEMLTGKRAFRGSTKSDVLAAILQSSPDWSALPAATPRDIVRLVRRCLEREPKARLHDIGDARLEIEDEERTLRGEAPILAGIPVSDPAMRWRAWALGGVAIIAIVAAALAVYLYSARRGEESGPEVRLQLLSPSGTRFINVPAVSPDGRRIVFVTTAESGGVSQLWMRPLAAQAATPLAGTEGARFPFWSPDSRSVGFFVDGGLKRINVAGGAPIVICDAEAGRGGAWLDDETIVFAPSQFSPLMRVSAAGGRPEPLTTLAEGETSHRFPQRLPGRQLLYYSQSRSPDKLGTRLVSLDDPLREVNFFAGSAVTEYVRGFLLFVQGSRLVAQRLSLPSGQLLGEPVDVGSVRISESFGRYVTSTAPSGVIAYQEPLEARGQFNWTSRDGRALETVAEPDARVGVELSPDGQRLATVRADQIWTLDLARPVLSRATARGSKHPIWSPDGTRIATLSQGSGTFEIVLTTLTTGASTLLLKKINYLRPLAWTRDGRTLVFIQGGIDKKTGHEIWTMPIDDPERAAPYLQDGARNIEARLSPDEKWIAYATDRSGRFEVEARSFPVPGARYPISLEGGGYPRWRADGRELYFVSAQSQLMAVPVTPDDPPAFGKPEPLFSVDLVEGHPDRGSIFTEHEYSVSVDGTRFLLNRRVSEGASNLTVILNWNPHR